MKNVATRIRTLLALLAGSLVCVAAGNKSNVPATPIFEKDVRPILKAHCFDCHGEGGEKKGGLDVRLRRLLVEGGEDGPAIVPGRPDQSRLIQMIETGRMPKREKKVSFEQAAVLRRWIASGAKTARPEPSEVPKEGVITEEERAFWSFQPIRQPQIPRVSSRERARTAIDAFLLKSMASQKVRFSPEADKRTLLRRVCLDLTGLPPTPEQMRDFLADGAPDAYERWVDRLLESKHYGERWGRHWLDIAGYADSDGYSESDPVRGFAYKYRDYVIRAFNDDLPMDRFITEQLAGDELAGATQVNASTVALGGDRARELLVATGFLRMGADGTAAPGGADIEAVRNQVVSDTLKIVSTSLLGLSVGCAQCHDHRYDPIPQADYYRMRAVFEPAYDWKQWRTPDQRLVSLYTEADRKRAAEVEAEAQRLGAEKAEKQKRAIEEALTQHLEKFEAGLRATLRTAFDTPVDKRTPEQKKLLADHPSVNIHPGVLYQYNAKAAEELKAMDAKIEGVRARKPTEDFISVLSEPPQHQPVTYLFHRGDYHQPKQSLMPGALSVLDPGGRPVEFPAKGPGLASSGRRLAFARWLTDGRNPLVARVLVNRVWMHHFGRGLVATPADFGSMGEKPSHPEMLDWLADDFMNHGWKLKRLHRLILTSTAYRQASQRQAKSEQRDPENRLYGRKSLQRLDAEAVRDSILAVSGALNGKMFGPPVPVRPDVHGQIVVGEDKTTGDNKMPVESSLNGEEFRRSVYIQVRRSRPLAMLHAFDAPVMEVNCEQRPSSTVATQALMLMNSEFLLDQALRFAERVQREAGEGIPAQLQRAWELAFQRPPTAAELAQSSRFLEQQRLQLAVAPAFGGKSHGKDTNKSVGNPPPADRQALANLCQALLSSNEFLYVD